MKYILLFIGGWVGSLLVSLVVGGIVGSFKSDIRAFISGLISPFILVTLITLMFMDVNENNAYDFLPIFIIVLPMILYSIRALYNGQVQESTNDNKFGELNINMKVNKRLFYGNIVGCVLACIYFSKIYSFLW